MILFWKQIGLVLQIVLVVAAVLLFSFFDPFNILKSKKQKLENTPIVVKSIREIGQLITSEFYGEVLNSLQQSRISQVMEGNVQYESEYKALHEQYQNAITDMIGDKGNFRVSGWSKKNDLYEYFYYRFSSLTENPYYQDYINWILTRFDQKTEKQLLKYFYTDSEKALTELQNIQMTTELSDQIEKITTDRLNELSADKKFRKQQIVVLGRGWVKAGIDFGKFTDNNFKYNKNTRTVHLIGIKPEILACTINPWFIPEKQVKGFEVILVSRRANEPKYMQLVKEETLKKLRNNAIEAGILVKARENAINNLKDFFSLLIPDGVDQVIIHDDFFSYFDKSMKLDSLNSGTMRSVDSLLINRFTSDSLEVVSLRDTLKMHKKIQVGDSTYRVQRFSSYLAFIDDEELTSGEMAQLETIAEQISRAYQSISTDTSLLDNKQLTINTLDTIWYYPDANLRQTFLKMANEKTAPERAFGTWQIISQSTKYQQWMAERDKAYNRMIAKSMLQQKSEDLDAIMEQIKNHASQVVIANVTFIDVDTNTGSNDSMTIDNQTIKYTSTIKQKISGALRKNQLSNIEELTMVLDSLQQLFNPENPQEFVPLRELAQRQYQYCEKNECVPIGKYSHVLAGLKEDSTLVKAITFVNNEASEARMDLDSLLKSGEVQHMDRLDSIWYFPSSSILADFESQVEVNYPEDGFTSFFKKTFSNKKYKQWQHERTQYYHQLIFAEMLKNKLLELERVKNIVLITI